MQAVSARRHIVCLHYGFFAPEIAAREGGRKNMAKKTDQKDCDAGDVQAIAPDERYDFSYTQNRELSWLRFDGRVLDEAFDETVPLFERLKFVAIFESNLDEFFMVRVGGLSDLATLKHQPKDNKSNLTPAEQVDLVLSTLPPMTARAAEGFHAIEGELALRGVRRLSADELEGADRTFVEEYFRRNVSPIISPLVIDPRHPFPNLRNGTLYLATTLSSSDEEGLVGLIEVPPSLPRVVEIPGSGEGLRYILLEDVIMACLNGCFGTFAPQDCAVLRVTRNADIDPDGEGVEEEEDYRQHMKKILKKRLRLQPVRLVVCGDLERETLKVIRKALELAPRSVDQTDIPLDLGYVFGVEGRIPAELKGDLLFQPFTPQADPEIDPNRPMREQIIEGDKLLFYPYESMDPFLRIVNEAAHDDECISIRITLYRVAKQSRLCESLISAAEHGKEVTVLMELRARFDEQNNIEWAERLEEAGCTVIYGSEGFKVHSKICQLTYRTGVQVTRLTLLGTGNFNEKTAKLYSDFMLMTAHPGIGEDANAFFRNLSLGNLRGDYRYLGVAPAGLKPLIMTGLNREIERARDGEPARVFLKMNSLTDREVIDKISEASRAGVEVQMIIRGISCLLPGVPGKTERVHVRSIVGRFLEHARVYAFGEDADTLYLSSADMMTRNTEHRVEIAFPVLDAGVRAQVRGFMEAQLRDNVKARELTSNGTWTLVPRAVGEQPFNAQEAMMKLAKSRTADAEREEAKRATQRPKVPAAPETAAQAEIAADSAAVSASAAGAGAASATAPEAKPAPRHMAPAQPVAAPAAATEPAGEPVRATIIEPQEGVRASQGAAAAQEEYADRDGLTAEKLQLTVRQHGRVSTGLALIGLGIRTLFGRNAKLRK